MSHEGRRLRTERILANAYAMKSIRERLHDVRILNGSWQFAESFVRLEAMRSEVMAGPDAGEKATYLQTRAAVLDALGRPEQALEAARAALELDLTHWPEGRGTFLTLHSMVLILQRLGQCEEAAVRARELLTLGERLGGASFAAAAVLAVEHIAPAERVPLLERAKFHCKAVLTESKLEGAELVDVARSTASVVFKLSDAYTALERIAESEQMLRVLTRVVTPLIAAPKLRHALAIVWRKLGALAERRGAHTESRLFLRYALMVLQHPSMNEAERQAVAAALDRSGGQLLSEDPQPLDSFRLINAEPPRWVGHPLRGCFPLTSTTASSSWQTGDAMAVSIDKQGFAHLVQ